MSLFLIILILIQKGHSLCSAYSTGDLHIRHLAGIWKLTTTTPRSNPINTNNKAESLLKNGNDIIHSNPNPNLRPSEEILLLLKEDGKFMQYSGDANQQQQQRTKNQKKLGISETQLEWQQFGRSINGVDIMMRGSWDYVDGKLILATDRPMLQQQQQASVSQRIVSSDSSPTFTESAWPKIKDTILEGKVVAVKDKSLVDNPALSSSSSTLDTDTSSSSTSPSSRTNKFDIHLSVPNGKVKIGKYAYPLHHPSFFDQPLFESIKMGSFHLQQIAGVLNAKLNHDLEDDEDTTVELFTKQDLMSKRYLLTSYPLPNTRQRRQRWSIKYNAFVDAKPKSKEEEALEEQEKNDPFAIKTFEVQLFANNTFTTMKGLGQDLILRGKWWIMGDCRDQLLMQVWRFGFGRSVSGSTYSEGAALSQKDAVSYWGKIYEVEQESDKDSTMNQNIASDPLSWKGKRIEVNGNLMEGWALEPCSVAKFTMVEITEEEEEEEIEEDEDDDDILDKSIGDFQ